MNGWMWMDEWMNVNGWVGEWVSQWVSEQVNEWRTNKWINEIMSYLTKELIITIKKPP